MTCCRRCLVSGRVQGVWYRAGTRDKAHELGLRGYAKNLADGRVEVVACGESDALMSLQQWLCQGPRLAEVTKVECSEVEPVAAEGFVTL